MNFPYIKEKYVNGTSWYRIYSDGWIEQGGQSIFSSVGSQIITYLKTFKNTNYTLSIQSITSTGNSTSNESQRGACAKGGAVSSTTTNNCTILWASGTYSWYACGY